MREVDEELRKDRALGIWNSWGRSIVIAVVVALAVFGGYLYWRDQQRSKAGIEGEQLAQAIDDLVADKTVGLEPRLKTLAASDAEGYRAAAKLALADIAMGKSDFKGAAAGYASVASDTALAQPYRDLALLRQTSAEYDSLKPEQVIARLKPLAVAGSPWFGSAGEMVAIAYMRMNKPDLAGATFAAMARDEKVPETIRSRVVQLAGVLGIDALPAGGPIGGPAATPIEDKN